jgi:hypothetical protein
MFSLVTNLSQLIFSKKTTEDEDDGQDYKKFFPPLMFLIRDFLLSLNGEEPDTYLAKVLQEQPGRNASMRKKNDIRRAIVESFPERHLRTIPPPVSTL